ncbi:MAG: hypothetical protein AAGG44_17940, partial [Planctomycetota bacterium]
QHYSSRVFAAEIAERTKPVDPILAKAQSLLLEMLRCGVPNSEIGITGSALIGAHRAESDLDFVLYTREAFRTVQQVVASAGESYRLGQGDWQSAFDRRQASISLEEYVWHESRKHNKLMIDGTKVDFGLQSVPGTWRPRGHVKKLRPVCFQAEVLNADFAFDTPARWVVDWETASEVVCWTATYVGQAFAGERVEVSGWLEETDRGNQVVVGTSREAASEYIRVLRS